MYRTPSRSAKSAMLALVCSLGLGGAACSQPKPEPQVASSSNQANYALDYPGELDHATAGIAAEQDELKTILGRLDGYLDALKDPKSIAVAQDVIVTADESGRSYGYVERARELEGVNGFFDSEGNDIGNRIAGSANYAAKQKSCEANVGGAAAGAVKPAVAKSVEKRMRDRNEAFGIIERAKTSLPKPDVAVLEKLADDVARASYLVNVALVDHKNRIRRMADEGDAVKKTIDAEVKYEQSWQAEAGRSDADKKASNERIEALNKAKAQIDASVQKSVDIDQKGALDKQIKDAQGQYADAIDAAKKKLKAKAKG